MPNNEEVRRPPVREHRCKDMPAWIDVFGTTLRDRGQSGNPQTIPGIKFCPFCSDNLHLYYVRLPNGDRIGCACSDDYTCGACENSGLRFGRPVK